MPDLQVKKDITKLQAHVQKLLDNECRKKKFDFSLRITRYFAHEDWIHFAVKPNRKKVRLYEFANVLSSVETKLARDEKIDRVMLMPDIGY